MRINQNYLGEIFRSRKICSNLKEAGSFTAETEKESGFSVYKEPESVRYEMGVIRKGDHFRLFNNDFSEEELDNIIDEPTEGYPLLEIHFHPGSNGPIVPSIGFDEEGEPDGDLYGLQEARTFHREDAGYDLKPIMGVAKIRTPTLIDVLLLQEKSDRPLGYGQLAQIEDALKPFRESYQQVSAEESYAQSLHVENAIKNTGLYSALILRYKGSRPLREDLERLVDFEFDEKNLRTLKPA